MNARTVLGIIAGDIISVGSTLLLFYLARVDPHAPATPRFMALSIVYGIGFALLAGFVAGLISRRPDLVTGLLLACVVVIVVAAAGRWVKVVTSAKPAKAATAEV